MCEITKDRRVSLSEANVEDRLTEFQERTNERGKPNELNRNQSSL